MSNKPQGQVPKVQIGGTISAEIAGKLRAEPNQSAIIETALVEYYAKRSGPPPPPPQPKCTCPDWHKHMVEKMGHLPNCELATKEEDPRPQGEKIEVNP